MKKNLHSVFLMVVQSIVLHKLVKHRYTSAWLLFFDYQELIFSAGTVKNTSDDNFLKPKINFIHWLFAPKVFFEDVIIFSIWKYLNHYGKFRASWCRLDWERFPIAWHHKSVKRSCILVNIPWLSFLKRKRISLIVRFYVLWLKLL